VQAALIATAPDRPGNDVSVTYTAAFRHTPLGHVAVWPPSGIGSAGIPLGTFLVHDTAIATFVTSFANRVKIHAATR